MPGTSLDPQRRHRIARIGLPGRMPHFAFELVEGNTATRLCFGRLCKPTAASIEVGHVTAEVERARQHALPAFTSMGGLVPRLHAAGS